ncbi:MAG TPA: flagellar hook-associated protein FlgK [Bacillota bacterium]|nr:flagellar hook-associated protein FlgK [Bacillota bacterium]
MRPTFLSFQTAARALAASQAAIDVTGNNISNVNTTGYSRQRVDLNAVMSSGYTERYSSGRTFVDAGVEASGISQIRDPFLDARYRKENAQDARYNSLLEGLSDLENVLDEASVDKLQSEFNEFVTQLQQLKKDGTSQDQKLVTRTAAQKITEYLNAQANQIDEIRSQEIEDLTDVVVTKDFNSIVQNIASLNKQIRTEELYGNTPNDLYDARNNLLDKLSGIANIKVSISSEKVSDEKSVSHMTVSLYDVNTGVSIGLVDADKYNTLAVHSDGGTVSISLNSSFMLDDASANVDPTNITKYFTGGSISASLDLINGNGTYANAAVGESSFRGTLYYMSSLNTLASTFADTFNKLNDIDGADMKPLFSSGTGGGPITAKNIQVSQEWLDDPNYINTTQYPDAAHPDPDTGLPAPGKGDNIDRMIAAMNDAHDFPRSDGTVMFNGSFNQYVRGTIGELSLDVELNKNFADASDNVMENLYSSRESVSGVLSDEEGINLMTYQKSYNAAARYFTALDEAVDVLINKGLVGR